MLQQALGDFDRFALGVNIIFMDQLEVFTDQCVLGGRGANINTQISSGFDRQYVGAALPGVSHLGLLQNQRRGFGHCDSGTQL